MKRSGIQSGAALPKPVHRQAAKRHAKQKRRAGERALVFLALGCVFVLGLLYVGTQNTVIEKGFVITDLKNDIEGLNDDIGHLNLTISELKAPARIEDIAVNTLGMHKAAQWETVYFTAGDGSSDDDIAGDNDAAEGTAEESGGGLLAAMKELFQRN